jgi:hypothetical protein
MFDLCGKVGRYALCMKICKFMYMYMSVLRGVQKYVGIQKRSYIVDTDLFISKILKGY